MIDIKDDDLYKIQQTEGVAIIDFWATWCGPCRAMEPVLEKLSEHATVFKANVDNCPHLVSHFNVQGVPTLVFFKDGKEQMSIAGTRTLTQLIATIQQLKDI